MTNLMGGLIAAAAASCTLALASSAGAADGLGAVLRDLEKSGYRWTPEVRESFLASQKARALEELAGQGIAIPAPLLSWIDETPAVAWTVYGIRHGSPAQALVLLRSLQLDLGTEDLEAHSPIVLAAVMMHSHGIDLADPEALPFVSLKERAPLKIVIPGNPLVKADTHPADRPLDLNDHIINFLEEEEVLEGGEVVSAKPRDPHLRACDVVAKPALQERFNAYMARKVPDFKPLACGDQLTWKYGGVSWRLPERKELGRAWDLFHEAYIAKGRLPKGRDPMPTPAEWVAYQINNAKTREADLPDVWPYAMYVVFNPQPLREAEYAWEEKAKGLRPMRYIEYVGKVAQDVPMLRLRRLVPFDYGYGSLAMMRKDGGVCGTHTGTSMLAGASLGVPVINCASPGHSFPGTLGKKDGVYSAPGARTGVKWYFGEGAPENIGSDSVKLPSLAAAMNWGIQGFVDSQLGWTLYLQLPDSARADHGGKLLNSALLQNPYNVSLARTAAGLLESPEGMIGFWEPYRAAVHSAQDRKGCLQSGGIVSETWKGIAEKLDGHPVPEDRDLRNRIYEALKENGAPATLMTRYEAEIKGIDAVMFAVAGELDAHWKSYFRHDADRKALVSRLQSAADIIDKGEPREKWLAARVSVLAGRGNCLTKQGKQYVVKQDEVAVLLAKLADAPIDETVWTRALLNLTTEGLDKHIKSRRYTPVCKDLAARLRVIVAKAEEHEIDLSPWAAKWFGMMDGKQAYAPQAWCQKDASSVVLDELIVKYPQQTGEKNKLGVMELMHANLQRELEKLNANTSDGGNQERINEINHKLDYFAKRIEAAKKAQAPPDRSAGGKE